MFEKFDWMIGRYQELSEAVSQPEIIADQAKWQKLLKEHASLEPAVMAYRAYEKTLNDIEGAKELLSVPEMAELAQMELDELLESKVQGSRRAMHGWRGYKLNGGGMLLDWGVHLIDQMLQLIPGKLLKVDAHLLSVFTPEVDDNIKLFLYFEGGVSAVLEMSTNCLINAPRWHVQGSEGTLQIDTWSGEGILRRLKSNAEMEWADDIVYTAAGPTRTMAPRPAFTMEEIPLTPAQTSWTDYYRNILDVLDGRAELIVKPEEALRVMRVIDLLFKSQEEGCGQSCCL